MLLQKLRQTWNKYNLYNFSRAQTQRTSDRSFFQQKWTAKSITRAYHGETVREKMWTRMFRRTMRSVVDFDPSQLAKNDGSQYATGRGSGLDRAEGEVARPRPGTPYLNMVYAPLERRLDTAVFRALFASSTRQARQFVVHGHVKVNGKEVSKALQARAMSLIVHPDDISWLPAESRRHVSSRSRKGSFRHWGSKR